MKNHNLHKDPYMRDRRYDKLNPDQPSKGSRSNRASSEEIKALSLEYSRLEDEASEWALHGSRYLEDTELRRHQDIRSSLAGIVYAQLSPGNQARVDARFGKPDPD